MLERGSNEEGKILKIQLFRCDPKGGRRSPRATCKIQRKRTVFANLNRVRSRTEGLHFAHHAYWSHEREGLIHVAGGAVDFLDKHAGRRISCRGHGKGVVVAPALAGTPRSAVDKKG
jgi:hypothetical protein